MRKISQNLAGLITRLWKLENINKESKKADLNNGLMSSYFIAPDFFLSKGCSQINTLRHNLVLRSF